MIKIYYVFIWHKYGYIPVEIPASSKEEAEAKGYKLMDKFIKEKTYGYQQYTKVEVMSCN